MRLQVTNPDEHEHLIEFPFDQRLADWDLPNLHRVLGIHRHEVKLIEFDRVSYVIKELPDRLVLREYELLREVDDLGLPTVDAVAAVTQRETTDGDGLLITRHLDYSLPYRSLLMGRGLEIPYLGERLLDAMVALLVRIHLAGIFWGDCSLNNTLFRRDAGALQAYIIDLETAEQHESLSTGQRELDVMIARDNMAGGLLDLQASGRLTAHIDPIDAANTVVEQYEALWNEITTPIDAAIGDADPIRQHLDRLHSLGFAVDEIEVISNPDGRSVRIIPKVVEHGYHAERLASLTGLQAGDNQARRMLQDIKSFHADQQAQAVESGGRQVPFNVSAVRWLDRVFEPTMAQVPPELFERLEAAELFHHLLDHRYYMGERLGRPVKLAEALEDYLEHLRAAPAERVLLTDAAAVGDPTGEITFD